MFASNKISKGATSHQLGSDFFFTDEHFLKYLEIELIFEL